MCPLNKVCRVRQVSPICVQTASDLDRLFAFMEDTIVEVGAVGRDFLAGSAESHPRPGRRSFASGMGMAQMCWWCLVISHRSSKLTEWH